MPKELKGLRNNDPNILGDYKPAEPAEPARIRHFMFSVVDPGDLISLPMCGAFQGGAIKHKMHAVDCPDCLTALDAYSLMDKHSDALAYAGNLMPKILTPDPEVMKERHGSQPSLKAQRHAKAKQFLDSKCAKSPNELPMRIVGGTPRTFYKNLYEIGIIDQDGEPTGLSAQDLANGKYPEAAESITED